MPEHRARMHTWTYAMKSARPSPLCPGVQTHTQENGHKKGHHVVPFTLFVCDLALVRSMSDY